MLAYQSNDGARIWTGEDVDALIEAMRADLAPNTADKAAFLAAWPPAGAVPAGQTVERIDAKLWLVDIVRYRLIRRTPNFDDSVRVVLSTFTVFTGLTLTRYLTGGPALIDIGNLGDWHWWAFFAVVALLLRYIIGSAVHLNYMYGGTPPRSLSVWFFFKDLMFLVIFGMLAVYIMESATPEDLIRRSMLFVLGGFIWSVLDYLSRRFVCAWQHSNVGDSGVRIAFDAFFSIVLVVMAIWLCYGLYRYGIDAFLFHATVLVLVGIGFCGIHRHFDPAIEPVRPQHSEWPGSFWRLWTVLDGVQFLASGLLLSVLVRYPAPDRTSIALVIALLAVVYTGFLFADLRALVRSVQLGLR